MMIPLHAYTANSNKVVSIKEKPHCSSARYEEEKSKMHGSKTYTPKHNDIIIGKGIKALNHSGNKLFRRVIEKNLKSYAALSARKEKSKMIQSIVCQIRINGGGFIKQSPEKGSWFEVSDNIAREKTSQAFRNSIYRKFQRPHFPSSTEETIENKLCNIQSATPISMMSSEVGELTPSTSSINLALENVKKRNDSLAVIDSLISTIPSHCNGNEDPFEPNPVF